MWEKESTVTNQAVKEAGEVLTGLFGNLKGINKKGEIDLVTEADISSEKAILEIIRENFPDDGILSEESGEIDNNSERLWMIDPLDGTTNYAHSFPFFAVSIALQVKGKTVLGHVFNPVLNEHFEAVKDQGAFLNGRPIKVSQTQTLKESLLATGFPYTIYRDHEGVIDLFTRMIVGAQGVRRPGAAAIDLCYVASGRFDGFWEQGLNPWDTAAGSLVVQEAGGLLSDYNGNAYSPFQKTIVAANPHIFKEMLRVLNPD
ncbi:MAG: inositol monophosphatase [Deltaproteobacteria bacterium]|nr:inositol monophosphatase [Deltaproteobacteria bacterium]